MIKTRVVIVSLLAAALFALTACADPSAQTPGTRITVFAAASMQETLTRIKELYETEHPEVELVLNLESSGTLKTQIEEGAECDLFISAAQKQMDQLDITVNPDGPDFVDPDTRVNLLENQVVLIVPDGNPKDVTGFARMAQRLAAGELLLAMGNSDVPAGQYAQAVFDFYGLDEAAIAAAGNITYGSNVKEVTAQVAEGAADCGIVYRTDAFSAGLSVVDRATPEMCGQVIYPAAVLKTSKNPDAARAFLEYLFSAPAMETFASVGFSPAA
ncbi:MAG: molybdate ABC transporter substrate-binding protein [Oscillibacter sp.]|nr:molybdate ABC transporter substrate-binding protein [Oscillibacter sp.]